MQGSGSGSARTAVGVPEGEAGVLVTFDDKSSDQTYESVLETMASMSKVVDALYTKAKRLS